MILVSVIGVGFLGYLAGEKVNRRIMEKNPQEARNSCCPKFSTEQFIVILHASRMKTQHNIKRTISLPANIAIIRDLAADPAITSRSKLTKRVCEEFSFYDGRGLMQVSSCVKVLRNLEQAGLITLPAPTIRSGLKPGKAAVRRLPEPVAPPTGVPAQVGEKENLQLVLVSTDEQLLIWNELMEPWLIFKDIVP